jgi:hypothetical protein
MSSPYREPNQEPSVAMSSLWFIEVLTEVMLRIQAFRDITPYRLVNSYRRFEVAVLQSVRRTVHKRLIFCDFTLRYLKNCNVE